MPISAPPSPIRRSGWVSLKAVTSGLVRATSTHWRHRRVREPGHSPPSNGNGGAWRRNPRISSSARCRPNSSARPWAATDTRSRCDRRAPLRRASGHVEEPECWATATDAAQVTVHADRPSHCRFRHALHAVVGPRQYADAPPSIQACGSGSTACQSRAKRFRKPNERKTPIRYDTSTLFVRRDPAELQRLRQPGGYSANSPRKHDMYVSGTRNGQERFSLLHSPGVLGRGNESDIHPIGIYTLPRWNCVRRYAISWRKSGGSQPPFSSTTNSDHPG